MTVQETDRQRATRDLFSVLRPLLRLNEEETDRVEEAMMMRTKESWRDVMKEVNSSEALARFVLGDLTHYKHGGAYERDDFVSLSNLISCLFEDVCEAEGQKEEALVGDDQQFRAI